MTRGEGGGCCCCCWDSSKKTPGEVLCGCTGDSWANEGRDETYGLAYTWGPCCVGSGPWGDGDTSTTCWGATWGTVARGLAAMPTPPTAVDATCLAFGEDPEAPWSGAARDALPVDDDDVLKCACCAGGRGDADLRKGPRGGPPCSPFPGGPWGATDRLCWPARFWQARAHFWAKLAGSDADGSCASSGDRWFWRWFAVVQVFTTGTCGGVSFLTYLPATPSRRYLRSFFFDNIRLSLGHCRRPSSTSAF